MTMLRETPLKSFREQATQNIAHIILFPLSGVQDKTDRFIDRQKYTLAAAIKKARTRHYSNYTGRTAHLFLF